MARGNRKTSEAELMDAVKRMGAQPEARKAASNSDTWYEFLTEDLGVSSAAIDSNRGKGFWRDVRLSIKRPDSVPVIRPTEQQLAEANATVYTNEKTDQVNYRGTGGRFVSRQAIIKGEVIGF